MSANLFKINVARVLAVAVLLWWIGGFSASVHAQGCCPSGGGHAGHGGSAPAGPTASGAHAGHGGSSSGIPQYGTVSGGHAGHSDSLPAVPQYETPHSGHADFGGSLPTAPQYGTPYYDVHAGHGDLPPTIPRYETFYRSYAGHESQPMDAVQTAPAPPHGGQWTMMNPLIFEVVYAPKEVRVYVYGPISQSEGLKDVKGEISLHSPKTNSDTRVALRYVAPPAGEQDYLSTPADLSGIKDGELTAAIRLYNLPLPNNPWTTFAQPLVLSEAKPEVTLAAIDKKDDTEVKRQGVCPVTGTKLSSMGDTIKVLIDGKPLYLCCQGCMAKVKIDPKTYLARVSQSHQSQ